MRSPLVSLKPLYGPATPGGDVASTVVTLAAFACGMPERVFATAANLVNESSGGCVRPAPSFVHASSVLKRASSCSVLAGDAIRATSVNDRTGGCVPRPFAFAPPVPERVLRNKAFPRDATCTPT